jgi:acyl-CoA synthetase (AMP-forming)/AMP-acid ligase II
MAAPVLRTVDELFRDCVVNRPDATIISYPSSGNDFVNYTCSQVGAMVDRAARRYSKILPKIRATSNDPRITVALLGVTNLDYVVSYLALQRLGLTCLFLSTRLQEQAFLHLFNTTNCEVVLVQPQYMAIMERTKKLKEGAALTILPMANFEYISSPQSDDGEALPTNLDPEKETLEAGWIIHSSGSKYSALLWVS